MFGFRFSVHTGRLSRTSGEGSSARCNWLKISRRHPELDLVIFQSTFPGTGKLWWHAVSPVGQITAMNNQQFLAVVGVIIVALIVYLSYERFRECQDLGGSHCYFGPRR